MTPEQRKLLIDALLDRDISETDLLRLEAELSVDPQVRQEFYARLQLDLMLERTAQGDAAFGDPTKPIDPLVLMNASESHVRSKATRRPSALWPLSIVTLAAAAVLSGIVYFGPRPNDNSQRTLNASVTPEPTAAGFALLSGQSAAVWDGEQIVAGNLLPSGQLHLRSGLAHIELFSGVQMVVQGDAVFAIESAMEVQVERGLISANVPEAAHGFKITTQHGNVVDLGTEFALAVDEHQSRVEVVSGEVELIPSSSNSVRIQEGELRELTATGAANDLSLEKIQVPSPADFLQDHSTRRSNRLTQWLSSTEELKQDQSLIAYYQMHVMHSDPRGVPGNELLNLAQSTAAVRVGAIVGCERTNDRWGRAESALDFSRMGSRVRVSIPGEYDGLSLYCWVKLNSLDRWFNSLFLTDGHEVQEPHWQIMNDGRLFFSVKKFNSSQKNPPRNDKYHFYSPVFWDASLSGKWLMLATVYDPASKGVTHYLDGKILSHEAVPSEYLVEKVKIGPASIGNWSEPMYRTDPEFVVRNLNGSIDEFAIFGRALSAEEIANLYRFGKPN